MTSIMPGEEELAAWHDPAFVTRRYLRILAEGTAAVTSSLTRFADPSSYPAVIHCSAGKDRTGILAAIVLGLLGVPDDVIVGDYMLSHASMVKMLAWMRHEHPDAGDALEHDTSALLSVEPESMQGFLDGIRIEFGSFEGLAEPWDVAHLVPALREALVE